MAHGVVVLAYHIDKTVRVAAGALGGSLFRPVEVVFVDRTVAMWGTPFGGAMLALAVGL